MRKVWITGGRGFAGQFLARELRGRGDQVWILDRTQRSGNDPLDDAAHSLGLDLADAEAVGSALEETGPDAIVHLAAQSSGGLSFSIPGETLRNNLESTLGLLEAIRHRESSRRPRFLSVGSCEEYGAPADASELPLTEDQALRPGNPYAVSKAAQTLLCQQYRRAHQMPVLCVRSFTHTGPGQAPRFVFSDWARQIAELEPAGGGELAVGNLEVSRDVSDVRDVVRAYADLLDAEWTYDVVNLCSGRELHLRRALDLLCEASREAVTVRVDPRRLRPADVPRFVGDASRLRELIGWIPSTPVEQTLEDLLESWRAVTGEGRASRND